ncbi:MAG: monovalent cation/H(+) antiporter subunit G [Thermoplasmata archaeon]|nr:MAG: cation:proton antiporter [Thermoplasmata archaeon]MCD6468931.1 monovalent cation/H(+) antiporter subunit G [Thermoplasmata archaeon]RLF27042.1 MAG: cation:proton antiporter [Thermoplasmata archaeon]
MVVTIIIYTMLAIGIFFNLLGSIGLLRFPDVYTRLHAGTKCTTFGSMFLTGAVIVYGLKEWYLHPVAGSSIMPLHVFIALIAILVTNPTGAHAIARAAHKSGVLPVNAVVDDLKEDTTKEKTKKAKEAKK